MPVEQSLNVRQKAAFLRFLPGQFNNDSTEYTFKDALIAYVSADGFAVNETSIKRAAEIISGETLGPPDTYGCGHVAALYMAMESAMQSALGAPETSLPVRNDDREQAL